MIQIWVAIDDQQTRHLIFFDLPPSEAVFGQTDIEGSIRPLEALLFKQLQGAKVMNVLRIVRDWNCRRNRTKIFIVLPTAGAHSNDSQMGVLSELIRGVLASCIEFAPFRERFGSLHSERKDSYSRLFGKAIRYPFLRRYPLLRYLLLSS